MCTYVSKDSSIDSSDTILNQLGLLTATPGIDRLGLDLRMMWPNP